MSHTNLLIPTTNCSSQRHLTANDELFLNVVIVFLILFVEVAYVNCIKRIYDDDDDDDDGNRLQEGNGKLQTWLRTVENDLKHQNLGLWSARHRAYNRELWREIVETATLL